MKLSINAGLLLLCSLSADAMKLYSPPSWSVRADMPYSASDFTATTLGDKIYIVGGCTGGNFAINFGNSTDPDWNYVCEITDKTLVYDPATDTFDALADAPSARYRHAAVAVGTEIIVFGGKTASNDTTHVDVDVLDTVTGTWTTRGDGMPAPTSDLAAFVLDGAVYAVGGYDPGYTALATVSKMNPATGAWTSLPESSSLNTARGDLGIGMVGEQVFAFGGFTHEDWSAPLASLEAFDAATMTWTEHPEPAKIGRGDKAVVGLHGRVLVLGGETKVNGVTTPLSDVEAFHPYDLVGSAGGGSGGTDSGWGGGWSKVGNLVDERFRFAAAAVGDSVYVFGGQGYLVGDYNTDGSYYPAVSSVAALEEQYLDTDSLWSDQEEEEATHEDEHEHDKVTAALACGVLGFLLGAVALLVAVTKRANAGMARTDPVLSEKQQMAPV